MSVEEQMEETKEKAKTYGIGSIDEDSEQDSTQDDGSADDLNDETISSPSEASVDEPITELPTAEVETPEPSTVDEKDSVTESSHNDWTPNDVTQDDSVKDEHKMSKSLDADDSQLEPGVFPEGSQLHNISSQLYVPEEGIDDSGLPYIYRRDEVLANRGPFSVELLDETEHLVRLTENYVSQSFDEKKVAGSDIREALLIAGLYNLHDVVSVLEKWGYTPKVEP